ncbi:MAG: UDP-N-acetylmuramoyl-tripeptide--D-alanyl-D-alanine ligase [Bacteroidales bacterium]
MTSPEQLYQLFLKHPEITTDSRNCPAGSLFFALKGDHFNGNDFVPQALAAGCAYAVCDEDRNWADERCLLTQDCLASLQTLAARHRQALKHIPLIALTGTNGKTTTKELTAAILEKKYRTLYTQGNLNNHIGVPLSLLKLRNDHQLAVIEMGANHPGEIRASAILADPDYGLITNVGKAHLEGFGSPENILATKSELYEYLRQKGGTVFVNLNHPDLLERSEGIKRIAYSSIKGKVPVLLSGRLADSSAFLTIEWIDQRDRKQYLVQSRLIGAYNLENLLAAICIGLYFDVPPAEINQALENYQPSNNRSQWQQTAHNKLIIDAYNANPGSMKAALEHFSANPSGRKAVILGSMKELGDYSRQEHSLLIEQIREINPHLTLLIGKEYENTETLENCLHFDTTEQCANHLREHPLKDYTILLKGSRANKLESLLELL